MTQKTCILILGMHRSGTSALTRLLNLSGASLPKTLITSTGGNETGHWESEKLVLHHDGFLRDHDSRWDDWKPLNLDILSNKVRDDFFDDVRALIRHEYGDADLIVVKDPRLCRFASLFIEAISMIGYKVKIIHAVRNPLEVSDSLGKRNGMSFLEANLLWLRHVLDAEFQSRSHAQTKGRSFITYDAILDDPIESLNKIAADFSLQWPHPPTSIQSEITSFIGPDHQHHNHSTEDVILNKILRDWVGKTYTILRQAQRDGISLDNQKQLDIIRDSFNLSTPVLLAMADNIKQLEQLRLDESNAAQGALENLSQQNAVLTANIAETQASNAALNTAVEHQKNEQVSLKNHHANLQKETEHTLKDLHSTQQEIQKLEGDVSELRQDLKLRNENYFQLEERLEAQHKSREQAQSQYATSLQNLEALKKEHTETERTLHLAQKNLRTENTALAQKTKSLELEKTDLKSIKSSLEQEKTDLIQKTQSLEQDKFSLEDKTDSLAKLKTSLKRKNTILGKEKLSLEQDNKSLTNLKTSIENKNTGLVATNKTLEHRNTSLLQETESLHSKAWELEQQLKNEISHNALKQESLDHILNSTSWKLLALPRKLMMGWRKKTLLLIGLLAGKSARDQLKAAGSIGELASNASSKGTHDARKALAEDRGATLEHHWLAADSGLRPIADQDLETITISAVTFKSEKWLPEFFASLLALDYPLEKISLHFIDNGSDDETVPTLQNFADTHQAQFATIQVFQRPNDGYGAGNDYGIRQSKDDFVLVTNVDTMLYADSLKKIVTVAMQDHAGTACWEYRQTPYEHPKYYDPVTHLTNWCSHCCVLMRKSAYLDVGGYEKRIFMYGEDVELSYRFRAYGWKLRYVPSAVIKHYVDLEDTTLRPNQLSGSASANILLRYRYGSYFDILAGEAFFHAVKRNETDPVRIAAWNEATRRVKANRGHFFRKRKFKKKSYFPFHEFDYDVIRPGANVVHVPFRPEEKSDLPLVSIITRTHGPAEHHLRNAVASVLGQTYPNLEMIVVEDRTHDAKEFCENLTTQYGDIIKYHHSSEGGRSACGNHGARQAKGQYLCWLDNDDMFFADHIETLVRALEQDPKAVCSYSLAWDALSKQEGDTPIEISYELPELHCRPYDQTRFLTENFIPIQSIIFSKSLFDALGGFNVDFSQLEDWNLWARYSQGGPFIYTPKVTSLYRTPNNAEERQTRHLALHAAYEDVRRANMDDMRQAKEVLGQK